MSSENSVVAAYEARERRMEMLDDDDFDQRSFLVECDYRRCEMDGCLKEALDDDIDCAEHALETAIDDLKDLMKDDHRTFRQVDKLVGRIAALKACIANDSAAR